MDSLHAINEASLNLFGLHYIELSTEQEQEITLFFDWAFNKYKDQTINIDNLTAEYKKVVA